MHHASPNRIPGLVWEDRVRTTNLFRQGSVAEHPTSPTDIAPVDDIQQGLPTHVKSVKRKKTKSGREADHSIGMACAYQLFRLQGYQRLITGIYEIEPEEVLCPDGKMRPVHRFTEVVETILSPDTLAAFRGDVTLAEISAIRDALNAYEYNEETIEKDREFYRVMTDAIRPSMGLARCTNKIDTTNSRIQAAVSLKGLLKQLATEGDYHGRFVQPNVIRHTKDFHGLALPWRTTKSERIFAKVKDPEAVRRRPPKKREADPHAHYLGAPVAEATIQVEGGAMAIARFPDNMRTIRAESSDDAVRRYVSRACKNAGGTWIDSGRRWLLSLEAAAKVVKAIGIPELPDAEGDSIMRQVGSNTDLFEITTPDGPMRAIRLPKSNWAIRPGGNAALAARVEAVCKLHRIGEYYEAKENWLIPQEPGDTIERVARAVQRYKPKLSAANDENTPTEMSA